MKRLFMFVGLLFILSGCSKELHIATTTSVDNTGLLNYLIEEYQKENNIEIFVVAKGTGAALELGRTKDVDLVIAHAYDKEITFVEEGYGTKRYDMMYNYFGFVSPIDVKFNSLEEFYQYMYDNDTPYLSRADNSGTHMKETAIFEESGVNKADLNLNEVGKGMGDTLLMASELSGFTLSDKGTFLSLKEKYGLYMNFAEDESMLNKYGILIVDGENQKEADKFAKWLVTDEVQEMIHNYKVDEFKENLFFKNDK